MNIIACNIRGFGCFVGEQFDFSEGLNCFLEDNGYGKTTMAAFLRVMFYGFKNESKKTDKERDNRQPWYGTEYGGSIDFEYDQKKYRIERRFGKKAADDELNVYDLETLTLSKDFTDPIGLDLFGVDAETFERTVYVSDKDISTFISDGVHAKIGDLVDDTVDVNRYTDAVDLLNSESNHLSETRKSGKLYEIKNRITELSQDVKLLDSIEERCDTADLQLKEALNKQSKIIEEQTEVQRKINQLADFRAVEDKIKKYDELEKTLEIQRKELSDASDYFKNGIPDSYDLQKAQQSLSRYEARQSVIAETMTQEETDQLKKLEQVYGSIEFSENDQKDLIELSENCQKDRTELADISSKIDQLADESRLNAGRLKRINNQMILAIIMFIAGAGLGTAGLLLKMISFMIAGIILAIAGAVWIIACIRNRKKASAAVCDASERQKTLENDQHLLLDRISSEEGRLKEFFLQFQIEYSPENSTKDMYSIFKEYDLFKQLEYKQKNQNKVIEESRKEEKVVKDFILTYAPDTGSDYSIILRALDQAMVRYNEAFRDFSRAKTAFSDYQQEIDIESLKNVEKPDFDDSLEDLSRQNRELDVSKKEIEDIIRACSKNEQDSRARLEKVLEERNELDELVEKQQELRERNAIIKKTIELLEKAKISLSLKLTDPVTKRFQANLSKILNNDGTDFRIDATGKIVLEQNGSFHNVDLMSSGYQALTYFCLRLALIDEMYKDEKPIIILDDPFTSLDEDKLLKAKELIEETAKSYQILYFTCHDSRSI